ncbi:ATP-binding protein [Bailinhaonella thermotolerans]|uniref:ATP-binding protein n=1 Tax=Bailinhaonella thermotolerans TaxID=1070861 RepID=A0A3A4AW75_9ACTN|nr:ATP-binding protein [Bailinhaonella thermotolerans]RJL32577.1 ATP-binding protein [Bailinhaonella thermotolerans]
MRVSTTDARESTRARGAPGAPPAAICGRAFRGRLEQVAEARRFVAVLLAGTRVASAATAVVSELVANAIRHTRSGEPGGLLVLQVTRHRAGVRIAVVDEGGPKAPALREPYPDDLAESGRGLLTVEAYATRWDWYGDADGRTVWADLTA